MNEFIDHHTAAKILGMTPNALYLAYYRRRPYLPPRYKFGPHVRYKRSEVMAAIKPVER